MQLHLGQIAPVPLRERINKQPSEVWLQMLTFKEGERIFVRAPSGTGKTTLIHQLYSLRTDFEGEIKWGSDKLPLQNGEKLSSLRTKDISIIFQDMRLFPSLTAWENLEVKRVLTNTIEAATVSEWMERLGIADKKDSLASTLSYGEQQRVSIVRALLQPFHWLLMDEPFSHLDDANIEKAIALIKEMTESNGAGLILADLEDNDYFNYTRKLRL